ncbi:sugar kinase [bacterium]|nr:sugar kinase [bacterium]
MSGMQPSLLVVGSVAYDTVRTAYETGEGLLGGSASHFSFSAALTGVIPRLVAVVGDDFSADDLARLEAVGADLAGVARMSGASFRWGGEYNADFSERETLFTELGVFENFEPVLPGDLAQEKVVFLANIHPVLQGQVLEAVDSPSLVALDTMNLWINITPDELKAVLPNIDLLFINDEEARLLGEHHNLVCAGEEIIKLGPKAICLKKGEHGVLLFVDGEIIPLPAYPVRKLVDPTGAGDSFAGGVMGELAKAGTLNAESLREAALAGTGLGSLAVEGLGVTGLEGRKVEEITDRLSPFKELLGISSKA